MSAYVSFNTLISAAFRVNISVNAPNGRHQLSTASKTQPIRNGPSECADQKRTHALLPKQRAVRAEEKFAHTKDERGA